jgi:hypothetical protein
MATLKNSIIDDTGYVQLPVGTTTQRPGSPSIGDLRFNSSLNLAECWNGSSWVYFPDIYRNRLVVNLDAAEPTSYSGSGTSWTNIGSFGGSVSQGTYMPQWTTKGGAQCFYFNQVGSYFQNDAFFSSPVPNDSTNLTIDVWVYLESSNLTTGDRNNICRASNPNAWYMSITKDTLQQSNYWYGKSPEGYFEGGTLQRNSWYNMVAVWDSTGLKQYLNGIKTTSDTTGSSAVRCNGIQIGWEGDSRQFHGAISSIKIYDIAIPEISVYRNFQVFRRRFGI